MARCEGAREARGGFSLPPVGTSDSTSEHFSFPACPLCNLPALGSVCREQRRRTPWSHRAPCRSLSICVWSPRPGDGAQGGGSHLCVFTACSVSGSVLASTALFHPFSSCEVGLTIVLTSQRRKWTLREVSNGRGGDSHSGLPTLKA